MLILTMFGEVNGIHTNDCRVKQGKTEKVGII